VSEESWIGTVKPRKPVSRPFGLVTHLNLHREFFDAIARKRKRVEFRGLRRYRRGRDAYYAIRLGRILRIRRWPG
jgi:hypothetical protein